jgi:hypothetical protein
LTLIAIGFTIQAINKRRKRKLQQKKRNHKKQ